MKQVPKSQCHRELYAGESETHCVLTQVMGSFMSTCSKVYRCITWVCKRETNPRQWGLIPVSVVGNPRINGVNGTLTRLQ